ncbi:ferrochelatase [Roseivirga sp. BDSF3-8]|uniref:ferrochelatase n=1 Tax=Roseivirga sp. BDSF3-8 TaxID=3241598 RepID=UPI003531A2C2
MRIDKGKKGVLLVNLGTPDSPKVYDVRKYLREFLLDERVIDINALGRWLLVNLIIAPFRAPKSAKVYGELWEDRGSPLLFYSEDVAEMLQTALGDEYSVKLAMRYQSPDMATALHELQSEAVNSILVIPLFPQYASATTGSVIQKAMEITAEWQTIPSLSFISNFLNEELFIKAHATIARPYLEGEDWDHVIFSYHGVPERQIYKGSCNNYCKLGECCQTYHKKNYYCYRAQCFQTSRLLAKALNIPDEKYTVTFQSRLGKDPWVKPYTDEVIRDMPSKGLKKILAFSPSFVSDCLETTIEVGEEFKEIFEESGGEKWQLVPSLNNHPAWIDCLVEMVQREAGINKDVPLVDKVRGEQ